VEVKAYIPIAGNLSGGRHYLSYQDSTMKKLLTYLLLTMSAIWMVVLMIQHEAPQYPIYIHDDTVSIVEGGAR